MAVNGLFQSKSRRLASILIGFLMVAAGLVLARYSLTADANSFEPVAKSESPKLDHQVGSVQQKKMKSNLVDKDKLSSDWTLKSLDGESIQLSSYRGQPVLLVFWATWCPYCKKLLPGIQKLHENYSDKGLKIIAVNIREDWKPDVYWRNHEYTFDAVLDGDQVAKIYGVRGTPGVVFVAPTGEVLAVKSFSDPEHPSLTQFAEYFTQQKIELE
ncbi:TlpA disulfide reductase family protein [Aliikangiella sp. G2MR2-5]|uniref:TlpA disulfide reductase family protein n=1 Tax=Aliikangiella sp. G2MR2-5 TaxID=2788943 RepID=UPI0018AAC76D|nr:redoxin domain-containing protein [Aliikangiella sp. G2MR2-5]